MRPAGGPPLAARLRQAWVVARALLPMLVGQLRRAPGQTALAVAGVALGVAVVVAIDLAADSARTAHASLEQARAGAATHRVLGGPLGVSDRVYVGLRMAGFRSAAPAIEGVVASGTEDEEGIALVGVAPLALAGQPGADRLEGAGLATVLLSRPSASFLGAELAARLGLGAGDELDVRGAAGPRRLQVAGIVDRAQDPRARLFDRRMVVDIGTAQELLGRTGWLDEVRVRVPAVGAEAWLGRLQALLPPGHVLEPVDSRLRETANLTRAFDTNLDMLGLLALLVGLLLVYNAMTFSVIVRRRQLGVLRSLGVTRTELLALVLAEALLIGLVASAIGTLLGALLAEQLLALVSRTVNDLYFTVDVRELVVRPGTLLAAIALGVAGTVAAALVPALEAARAPPASAVRPSTLEEGTRVLLPRIALGGVIMMLVGVALLGVANLQAAFATLFCLVLGAAAMTPLLMVALTGRLAVLCERLDWIPGALAVHGVRASASRTGVAVAALTVALGATLGVSLMIDSFRLTVDRWISSTLQAEFYVFTGRAGPGAALPARLPDFVRGLPGVEGVSVARRARVRGPDGPVSLFALEVGGSARSGFELLSGDGDADARLWARLDEGEVFVSEPWSNRFGVAPGDSVRLDTSGGWQAFRIAAVYRDYGQEQGTVLMALHRYRALFGDPAPGTIGVYLTPEGRHEPLMASIRAEFDGGWDVRSASAAEIRATSLAVFDRTFAVTRVLRLVTLIVAFIGVLSALMALQLERRRELAVLRATGFTRTQSVVTVLAQTASVGLVAGIAALPVGAVTGLVLVEVINRRAFGWTVPLELTTGPFLAAISTALVAALLAGVWPAWRLSVARPADGLRYE